MTDIQQVTDTMTYEVNNSFTSFKEWSGDYHVMKIIKQTEKAVYCRIENQNRFAFTTWIPKSCLIQVEREAPKSSVRAIGSAECKWVVYGKMGKGYADWKSAKRYIMHCAKKYGLKYIRDINLNDGVICLDKQPCPCRDSGYAILRRVAEDDVEVVLEAEVRRLKYWCRSPCSVPRDASYFKEE